MKHLLQALDQALERGEAIPARPFSIMAAIERVAPDLARKPVSLAHPVAAPLPVPAPTPAAKPALVRVAMRLPAADDTGRPLRGAALAKGLAKQCQHQPERMTWPDSWFETTDPADAHRCQQMWAEALRIGLLDACETVVKDFDWQIVWDATPHGLRTGQRPGVRVSWVGTSDFMEVCALAGLDGEAVAQRVNARLTTREGAAALGRSLTPGGQSSGRKRASFAGGDDE